MMQPNPNYLIPLVAYVLFPPTQISLTPRRILTIVWPIGYRMIATNAAPVRLPPSTKHLLDILFLGALVSLGLSTPYFAPENVYSVTKTDLVTSPSTVFTALSTYRNLTSADIALRNALSSNHGRLLYAWIGPEPLLHCSWCNFYPPKYYLYYAGPRILIPHLVHAAFIGAAMSSYFGRFGPYWRFYASFPMLLLAAYELSQLGRHGVNEANLYARGNSTTDWHFWRMRTMRLAAFAALDALLGLAVWLSATRRWNLGWEGFIARERTEEALKKLHTATTLIHAGGLLKQTAMRDPTLREKAVEWWAREAAAGKELMRDEEVVEVKNQMNVDSVSKEAEVESRNMVGLMWSLAQQREQAQGNPHQQ